MGPGMKPGAGWAVLARIIPVLSLAGWLSALAAPRPGMIQFSNGDLLEGKISLTPGADLKIHVNGKQIRNLDLSPIREIRLVPAEEKMERRWRFLEAGQTKKEFSGEPYLTRTLTATITLAGGEKITGHLYTTVFYLETADKAHKVIVQAKQRGKEGEGADALKYPTLIAFTDEAGRAEDTLLLDLKALELPERAEVTGLAWGSLLALPGRPAEERGRFRLPSPLGNRMLLAVKAGGQIQAGWPQVANEKIQKLVQANMANAEDFFDQRNLLGVFHDLPNADVYSLVIMFRTGKTTLDRAQSQPWRLVVQRWKYDEESERLLLAGRGCFFRGILAKGEQPPVVTVTPRLWNPNPPGAIWKIGGTTPAPIAP